MKALYALPLLLFLGLTIYFAVGLTLDPRTLPSTLIDRPVPSFDLPPIENRSQGLSSADLHGAPTLINVFASWCVACEYEHPTLMEIARKGEVAIHGVNWKDKPGDGTRWLERRGDPYTRIGNDAEGRVAIDLGVTGAPETFVVDANGRIRYKHVGPVTPEVWRNTLLPLIKALKRNDASVDSNGGAALPRG